MASSCRFLAGFSLLIAVSALVAFPADASGADTAKSSATPPILQTYVTKYCVGCHGPTKQNGSLSLHNAKAPSEDRSTWQDVLDRTRANEMPPPGKPKPSDAEKQMFMKALEAELSKVTCTGPVDPGRVTLRRLNRVEYNNTIRDLLGVDFRPADDFPSDDVGYGFDNIGDVLSLSPLLLERYLAAAETIVDKVFTGELPPQPPKKELRVRDFKATDKSAEFREKFFYLPNGELQMQHEFASDGEYTVRFRTASHTIDREPVKVVVKLDGKEVYRGDAKSYVENRSLPIREITVRSKAGAHTISFGIGNPQKNPDKAEQQPRKKERALLLSAMEVQGPNVSTEPIMSPAFKQIMFIKPGPTVTKNEAARRIIEAFARRAFRRPPFADEVQRYVKLAELADAQGEKFEGGIRLAVQAMLVSPHFLFKVERDRKLLEKPYLISEHELATRLSYFLWSSMPDDELFKLADRGGLRKQLDSQVRRMLKDPKAEALGENFAGQWLQIRNLKTAQPDSRLFPKFNDALREAMLRETTLFFNSIVQEDRSIFDFLDANYTYLNERLAKHYGISGVSGSEFRRVSLEGSQRAGILTHGSVLTVTSNVTRTSPVKRGKYIMENLLAANLPPPPPDVPDLSEEKAVSESASLRQRMEQHRSKSECAVCHQRMDPLGFAFENFDAVGAWREKDGKFPIDPSGVLPDGRKFGNPAELRAILKTDHEKFRKCVCEKLLTYALGRGLESSDRCAVDAIALIVRQKQDRFAELVIAVVNSEPFQKRTPSHVGKSQ